MHLNEKYFCHFPNLPELSKDFITRAMSLEYPLLQHHTSRLYANFNDQFWETNFFKTLTKDLGRCGTGLFYYPEFSTYDWHTDKRRRCSLNWVIKTNPKAATFYKEPIPETIRADGTTIFNKLIEIDYTIYRPTLLNIDIPHCAMNNYNDSRIILSMSMFESEYEDVKNYLKNMKCENY